MISDTYKQELQKVHNRKASNFKTSLKKYGAVKSFIETYKPTSVIDYGCGKGTYVRQIQEDFNIKSKGYDPGVTEFENLPIETFDCLISNDVIEHFEPEYLTPNLQKMQSLFTKAAWLIIACYPAKKHLPDGRNAHLIIEDSAWWRNKIEKSFDQCIIKTWHETELNVGKPEIRIILEKL